MKTIIIIILITLVGYHTSQAQFGKKLSQMISGKETPVADQYSFNTKVVYQMTIERKGKTSAIKFGMHFPLEGTYLANEIAEVSDGKSKNKNEPLGIVSVMDFDHMATIVFMEQNKIAQVVPLDDKMLTVDLPSEAEVSFEKTGTTKNILGHTCHEYKMDSPEQSGTFWMTTDVDTNYQGYTKALNQSFKGDKKSSFQVPEGGDGLMMELDITTKGKRVSNTHMLVVEISEEEKVFSLSDYQVMNGGMMSGLGSK